MRDEWSIDTLVRLYSSVAQYEVQLKFVVQTPEDMFEAIDIVKGIEAGGYWKSVACPIIFQPDGLKLPKFTEPSELYAHKMKEYYELMKKMTIRIEKNSKVFQKYDVRVLPQLHRLLWPELKNI